MSTQEKNPRKEGVAMADVLGEIFQPGSDRYQRTLEQLKKADPQSAIAAVRVFLWLGEELLKEEDDGRRLVAMKSVMLWADIAACVVQSHLGP